MRLPSSSGLSDTEWRTRESTPVHQRSIRLRTVRREEPFVRADARSELFRPFHSRGTRNQPSVSKNKISSGGRVKRPQKLRTDQHERAAPRRQIGRLQRQNACTNRREFGAICTEPGNPRLRRTAWWGWEDSNFQPNGYCRDTSEPGLASLIYRRRGRGSKTARTQHRRVR
jgi:hypothetical protein